MKQSQETQSSNAKVPSITHTCIQLQYLGSKSESFASRIEKRTILYEELITQQKWFEKKKNRRISCVRKYIGKHKQLQY